MRTTVVVLIFILIFIFSGLNAQEKVKVYGRVTDFNGHPIDSVTIRLKNKKFENVYETLTGKDGQFSLLVKTENYYCLYAIKLSDYKKTKLEYWAWNLPLFCDLEINPQYDNMEVYGINAFEPQVTPHETYSIYFRPMSLKKGNVASIIKGDTVNMAPERITPDELDIRVNGAKSQIVVINKVTEYARGGYFFGYMAQVLKPDKKSETIKDSERIAGYDKISIILKSNETGEIGKGETFIKHVEK